MTWFCYPIGALLWEIVLCVYILDHKLICEHVSHERWYHFKDMTYLSNLLKLSNGFAYQPMQCFINKILTCSSNNVLYSFLYLSCGDENLITSFSIEVNTKYHTKWLKLNWYFLQCFFTFVPFMYCILVMTGLNDHLTLLCLWLHFGYIAMIFLHNTQGLLLVGNRLCMFLWWFSGLWWFTIKDPGLWCFTIKY